MKSLNKFFVGVCLALSLVAFTTVGCAPNQSATQQIVTQTKDPITIARAVYLDGLTVYRDLLASYQPYHEFLAETNPELAEDVLKRFVDTWELLKKWDKYSSLGQIDQMDQATFKEFRIYILQIVLELEAN